jgi:hypothetical protein
VRREGEERRQIGGSSILHTHTHTHTHIHKRTHTPPSPPLPRTSLCPSKMGRLLAISATMQAIDHVSIVDVYESVPNSTSGARYHSVTTCVCVCVCGDV